MPDSRNGQSPLSAWPGILVAFLLGIGAVNWLQTPFKPERPIQGKEGLRSVGAQDVDARLWQDPFAAVAEARKERKSSDQGCRTVTFDKFAGTLQIRSGCATRDDTRHDLAQLSLQIKSRGETLTAQSRRDAPPLTIIAVMVDGGPSIGAAESRRRHRYAVLSGLQSEGYLPDDAEHIGYLELGPDGPPAYIPFEWLSREARQSEGERAALLLWLDDRSFGLPEPVADNAADIGAAGAAVRPLARLSRLLTEIYRGRPDDATTASPETEIAHPTDAPRISFQIIGPADSTTLRVMAAEQRQYERIMGDKQPSPPVFARIWSPLATIPSELAGLPADPRPVCFCGAVRSDCIAVRLPSAAERTIAADDVLAEMLVAELARRRVAANARVALVGQWDTAYSRTLAKLFTDSWTRTNCAQTAGCGSADVKRFSYMRGLDGQIPGAKPKDKADDNHAGGRIERPAGDPQIDYLRRMRDELLAEDAGLRAACGWKDRIQQRCGFRAIGVIGNDYHDKLLVLQALKPVFPDAVFFTTDLDAAMLHPLDNQFTRNLIVASGFGLTLAPRWQGEIPPLRDSYQAAMLLTVHLAIRDAFGEEPAVEVPPPPRLFEIGRTEPVELVTRLWDQPFERTVASPGSPAGVDPAWDAHPREELVKHFTASGPGNPAVLSVLLPAALLLAVALIVAAIGPESVGRAVRDWMRGLLSGRMPLAVGVFSILVTASILALMRVDVTAGGEPYSLLEGVSIWPSEILRLGAGLVAVFFFILGHHRQRQACVRIEQELPGLKEPASTPAQQEDDQHARAGSQDRPSQRPQPAAAVWRRYADRCGIAKTVSRVWPEVILFFLLAFTLMIAFGFPNRPTRSSLSWGLDFSVIMLVLVPFLALLFYMVDATRQALRLAKDLSGPVVWPSSTLQTFGFRACAGDDEGEPPAGADLVWLDVRLIANATRPVGNLVWYPIVVLILLALARHPLFDAWTLPPALMVVMVLAILYAVLCALLLRRAAEHVREEATRELTAALLRAQGQPEKRDYIDQLRTLLAEIAKIREGAFRPFSQQPVVQSLLALVSSVSGLALLDYSSLFNV